MSIDHDLVERVRLRVATSGSTDAGGVAAALRAEAGGLADETGRLAMLRAVHSELVGGGPLEPLLRDPSVTDILVNGPTEVWVDRGVGLQRCHVGFTDDAAVRRLVLRLIAPSGRRLDDAQPWVDARLADGVRLHAVLPPISPQGTVVSFRLPARRAFGLDDLVAAGSTTAEGARLVRAVVEARLAFVVTGGTGSGKTTWLSTLLGLADRRERIVLVEDAGELRPDHPHVLRLEARPANVEGAGAVTLRDLVRQAMRMRPDRLVVGEVRGGEVVDLLAALNTGHDGGCCTVHANSAAELPARLEALGLAAGLSRGALHSQVGAGLHAVLHLARDAAGRRRLRQVCVVVRGADGLVEAQPAVTWSEVGTAEVGAGLPRLDELLAARGVRPAPLRPAEP